MCQQNNFISVEPVSQCEATNVNGNHYQINLGKKFIPNDPPSHFYISSKLWWNLGTVILLPSEKR
jgi:hypothetical protein